MQGANAFNKNSPVKPWYAQRWPWLLMLGPFVVILAGIYTTWLAVTRPDAMVVDDYYVRGKAINQDLSRDRVASAMRVSMSAQYVPDSGQIHGSLLAAGVPLVGKIDLHLAHATQPHKDLHIITDVDQAGHFSAPLPMLERGRWQVLVESEQRNWRLNGIWKWPEQKAIELVADLAPAQ